jgi:hypothetical protein
VNNSESLSNGEMPFGQMEGMNVNVKKRSIEKLMPKVK